MSQNSDTEEGRTLEDRNSNTHICPFTCFDYIPFAHPFNNLGELSLSLSLSLPLFSFHSCPYEDKSPLKGRMFSLSSDSDRSGSQRKQKICLLCLLAFSVVFSSLLLVSKSKRDQKEIYILREGRVTAETTGLSRFSLFLSNTSRAQMAREIGSEEAYVRALHI